MNCRSHSLLVAGLLTLGASAMAQPPGPPPPGPGAPAQQSQMERPGMRTPPPRMQAPRAPVTRTALQAELTTRFDAIDANHDGKLDAQDREERRNENIAAAFGRLDRDGNGAISKEEFAAAPQPFSGPPPQPRRAMMFAPHGPGGPDGAMPPPPRSPMAAGAQQPITKVDFVARGLARFDQADTDHDGTISPAERDAVRGTMRDRRDRAPLPASRANPQPPGQ